MTALYLLWTCSATNPTGRWWVSETEPPGPPPYSTSTMTPLESWQPPASYEYLPIYLACSGGDGPMFCMLEQPDMITPAARLEQDQPFSSCPINNYLLKQTTTLHMGKLVTRDPKIQVTPANGGPAYNTVHLQSFYEDGVYKWKYAVTTTSAAPAAEDYAVYQSELELGAALESNDLLRTNFVVSTEASAGHTLALGIKPIASTSPWRVNQHVPTGDTLSIGYGMEECTYSINMYDPVSTSQLPSQG